LLLTSYAIMPDNLDKATPPVAHFLNKFLHVFFRVFSFRKI
jgi:hypothetical protein